MPPVSRSSTESSSPKSCYFPITLITMIIPCVVTFLKNSIFDNFLSHFVWEKLILRVSIFWINQTIFSIFLKSSIFENFFKCFDPFCIGKNWFWDVQFFGWIKRFWAFYEKFHFWKFLQVFWPILYGKKLILRFSIFWMNQKILSIFQKIMGKIMLLWWKKVIKFDHFFPSQ